MKKLAGLLASAILLAATHLTRFSRDQQAVVTRRSDRLVMLVFEAQPVSAGDCPSRGRGARTVDAGTGHCRFDRVNPCRVGRPD